MINFICFFATIRHYKTLIKEFLKRNIQNRFIGSFAGSLWLIIIPLSQILIYYLIFGVILKMRISIEVVGTDNLVAFLLSGLLPWMAFSEALTRGANSIVDNAPIISKIVMPVEILPLVETFSSFVLGHIGFVLFVIYLAYDGYAHPVWFLIPVVIIMLFFFAIGLIFFLSAITVFFRDTQQILNIIMQAWFYLTPIIYPIYMIPEKYRHIEYWNPVYPFIALIQQLLFKHLFSPWLMAEALCISVFSFMTGYYVFMKLKLSFNDVL